MDLEYRADADRRDALRAVGADSARIADVEIEPALFLSVSTDVAFDDVRVRTSTLTLHVLTTAVVAHGFKAGDAVQVKGADYIIGEPPTDEDGITVLALRKP